MRAYKVIVNILKQGKFQTSASDLLVEDDHVEASIERPSRSPERESLQHTTHSDRTNTHGAPPPSGWYSGSYLTQNYANNADFNPTPVDPQLLVGLGQPQVQQGFGTNLNQVPPQADPFMFMEDNFNNPYMFANPFMTDYDQGQPFGLDDLWPQGAQFGDGGLAQQQGSTYQGFGFMPDQNQQMGDEQPH